MTHILISTPQSRYECRDITLKLKYFTWRSSGLPWGFWIFQQQPSGSDELLSLQPLLCCWPDTNNIHINSLKNPKSRIKIQIYIYIYKKTINILFFACKSRGKLCVPDGNIEGHRHQFKNCILLGTGTRKWENDLYYRLYKKIY